jgi:hypothetical protein
MNQLVDDTPAQTEVAGMAADHERSDLRHASAQRRELGARDNPVPMHGDDKAMRPRDNLVQLAREQVTLHEMIDDQGVDGRGVGGRGTTQGDPPA